MITVTPLMITVSATNITTIPLTITVTAPSPALSPTSATVAQLGTRQLAASGFTGGAVAWSSSDTTVATVGSSGLVTALAQAGTAVITARGVADNTQSANCAITVPVAAVSITSIWNAGPGYTGLTGTIRVEWTDASGTEVQAVTTSGIVERIGTGIYRASFPSATAGQVYLANWDAGAGSGVYFTDTPPNPNDKTGYSLAPSGLDEISVADPGPASAHATLPMMLVATWRSLWKRSTQTVTTWKRYADDGVTVNSSSPISDDGTTQTIGNFT